MIVVHNVEGLNLGYPIEIDSFQTHSETISVLANENPNALVEYQFGDAYMYATMSTLDALNQGDIHVQPVDNGQDFYTGFTGVPENSFIVDYGGILVGI